MRTEKNGLPMEQSAEKNCAAFGSETRADADIAESADSGQDLTRAIHGDSTTSFRDPEEGSTKPLISSPAAPPATHSKATPGPWTVSGDSVVTDEHCIANIETDGGYERPAEERAANAKLIASAPALAEENGKLRKVLERCVKALDGAYILDGDQECIEASQEARALLGGPSEPSHCGR